MPVQVNGKVRAVLEIPPDLDRDSILAKAKEEQGVRRHTDGKNIVKEIYVPGKMVNFVAK
jgi:leucyl-tRNA synthetase